MFRKSFKPSVAAKPAATTKPTGLSTAIDQLKSGDKFAAQNSLRKAVGLSEVAATPAGTEPTLANAISTLKTGNKAGATDMLRSVVGLPSSTPAAASVKAAAPANGLARFAANKNASQTAPAMKSGGKVSASKRGDGIAQRGKTKGRYL